MNAVFLILALIDLARYLAAIGIAFMVVAGSLYLFSRLLQKF